MSRRTTQLGLSLFALVARVAFPAEALAELPGAPGAAVVEELAPLPPPPYLQNARERSATADVPEAPAPPLFKRRPFVGIWGGVGFASVVHPQLGTPHVYGPLLAFQAGLALSPEWSLSLEFTNLDRSVARTTEKERFASSATFLHSQADCMNCSTPPAGGPILATTLLLNTVGPRVDFTPFGVTGPYLGATGGLAVVTMLDRRVGGGGTARAGFRLALADALIVGLEGGVQGQAFSGGSAVMGFGALSVQLAMFETRSGGKKPGVYVVPQRAAPTVVRTH